MNKLTFLLLFCVVAFSSHAQINLLRNSSADSNAEHWKATGAATVENTSENNPVFVLRNKGSFTQTVKLKENSVGKYALLIGRGASERVNSDGVITGLPYLYGYLMDSEGSGGRIKISMTGQNLLGTVRNDTEWTVMFGVFQIPEETFIAQIFLNQAERKDVPQNGSAARFDDVGFYIFDTKKEVLEFVKEYERKSQVGK